MGLKVSYNIKIMWKVQQEFKAVVRETTSVSTGQRNFQTKKTEISSKQELRENFKKFFKNRYNLDQNLMESQKRELRDLKKNIPNLFVELIEFKGLDSISLLRDIDDRSSEKLKSLLTIFEIYFEEYINIININARKTISYFEFIEHLRNLASEYYDGQIEVKHESDYMTAFSQILVKKSKLIKSAQNYLNSGDSLSLLVERIDEDKLNQMTLNAEKLTLFDIVSRKGTIIRDNEGHCPKRDLKHF